MKTFQTTAAQGELGFMRLPDDYETPKGAKLIEPTGPHTIVGHSETGHHHVLDAAKTELYQLPDSLSKLLIVSEDAILTHLRDHDTHEPTLFASGKYHVRQLREYNPTTRGFQAQYD